VSSPCRPSRPPFALPVARAVPRPVGRSVVRAAAFATMCAAALALATGCDGARLVAEGALEGRVASTVGNGFEQVVTVRSAPLLDARDIEVRSVIINTGTAAAELTHRICGLDYGGSLVVGDIPAMMRCLAYSGGGVVQPGDSVVTTDLMRVASGTGTYTFRVRHALVPDHWAELAIRVP
jgi:hypothetical protein